MILVVRMSFLKAVLIFSLFACIHFSSQATVVLQYHHVSDTSPASTSISPSQFTAHMQYLKDNGFTVIALPNMIESMRKQQALPNKSVVITFDDAYLDILENGTPILNKFSYPYTIFTNAGIVNNGAKSYMNWQQLKGLSEQGVTIANHGYYHDSLTRTPKGQDKKQWLAKQLELLEQSEQEIKQHTGQNWRYFAYPYGEFTPEIQEQLALKGYVAFTQQSGAVGLQTDLTIIPRFPASQPYDKLSSLRDKLNSLPFNIVLNEAHEKTVVEYNTVTSVSFNVTVDDFRPSQLNCYVSGLGKQKVQWLDDENFSIAFDKPLPSGRVRCNCTAPSISESGRYYWFSKPWFVLKPDKNWYPL